MTLTLEQLANLAEVVAAVAVVPSLIYLAVQVRQGNKQVRATARYAFVEAMADINLAIAQDRQLACVWRRGLASADALDDDEVMQFWCLLGQYCNAWVVLFRLHEDGLLPENQWHIVRNDVHSVLGSEGGRAFWRIGKGAFDDQFGAFVNDLLGSSDRPYDMLAR